MQINRVVPGCFHVEIGERRALLGAPPESIKLLLRAGLRAPTVGVLPDVAYVEGVSQVALEFLAYWYVFFETGGWSRPFRVVGTRRMCERVRQILSITLLGPTREQLKGWKLSRTRIETLTRMMDYLAIRRDDRRLAIDDLFEFAAFEDAGDGAVPLFGADDLAATVKRLGDNRFEIESGGRRRTVDLAFEGEQLPLLADPPDELEIPQVLRVKLLGSYSGFDPGGPTTGIVLWVNGNAFLVDGPVGTSAYLRRLGVPKSDLRGVIVSHVHDDHCTLIDMILSEQRVNIITTREIYESMLIKISCVLGEPLDQMRGYLSFTEVVPGKSVAMYGAKWEFFYAVHTIPTIGFRVSVRGPDGGDHTVVYSSDTIHFEELEKMRMAGAISAQHAERMKNLVGGGERLAIVDGGGRPIHGVPSDYTAIAKAHPETELLFFHVAPEKVADGPWGVATPGWSRTLLPGASLPQPLVLKILKTLKLLEISDQAWINVLLSQGRVVEVPRGVEVVSQGQAGDSFYFVLAGSQEVLDASADPPRLLAVLEGGDFFGEMSIILEAERNATVRTLSRSLLFVLPGDLFLEFVEANDLAEKFERIWLGRSIISKVRIFRNLHPHAKHELSLLSVPQTFDQGAFVMRQGGKADGFYIITRGIAEVIRRDRQGRETMRTQLKKGDFFGENVAMGYRDRRNASVVVKSETLETLRLSGADLRRFAAGAPILRHELHLAMKQRGMIEIPSEGEEGG
ncbi:MAG: cyclic nucleotide-binding domain-containing protein [Proteobacteria bacterium]|nr:cyclic nucleotide-binding domain-containing protein [Pseudomonadota bacterium]